MALRESMRGPLGQLQHTLGSGWQLEPCTAQLPTRTVLLQTRAVDGLTCRLPQPCSFGRNLFDTSMNTTENSLFVNCMAVLHSFPCIMRHRASLAQRPVEGNDRNTCHTINRCRESYTLSDEWHAPADGHTYIDVGYGYVVYV